MGRIFFVVSVGVVDFLSQWNAPSNQSPQISALHKVQVVAKSSPMFGPSGTLGKTKDSPNRNPLQKCRFFRHHHPHEQPRAKHHVTASQPTKEPAHDSSVFGGVYGRGQGEEDLGVDTTV